MEFSGRDESGTRVMGLVAAKGMASVVDVRQDFLWRVPVNWSLEQAATVPVAYCTAFYALVVRGRIRAGTLRVELTFNCHSYVVMRPP